jgi:hypothetical protein
LRPTDKEALAFAVLSAKPPTTRTPLTPAHYSRYHCGSLNLDSNSPPRIFAFPTQVPTVKHSDDVCEH